MTRFPRTAVLALALGACGIARAGAQAPPLVFTTAAPERSSDTVLQASPVVEERGLALWGGTATDFGVGVAIAGERWSVRSIDSMVTLPIDGHSRPTFQQIEITRHLFFDRLVVRVGRRRHSAGVGRHARAHRPRSRGRGRRGRTAARQPGRGTSRRVSAQARCRRFW